MMDSKELKVAVDALFPFVWKEDFQSDLDAKFAQYISILSGLDGYEYVVDEVKATYKTLIDIVSLCYDGRRGDAFNKFKSLMNNQKDKVGLFSSIGTRQIDMERFYYRARERKRGEEFSVLDMFHIPLDKRGIVSTQRYSCPGYPCLYLGNSVYACWEEMRRPTFDSLMFSAYKTKQSFGVFDLRIPDEVDYQDDMVKTLKRIPIVLACSIVVKNPDDVFKPEYIIPQLLTEIIICNNREITKSDKSPYSSDVIWGVIFTSTHINSEFPYGKQFLENIVLPVVDNKSTNKYCHFLASLFDITLPLCYEYESLKENTARSFWGGWNTDKTQEEIERDIYQESKMGYMEEKLKDAQFQSLPYIYIDSPDNGLIIPQQGGTASVRVISNVDYQVNVDND